MWRVAVFVGALLWTLTITASAAMNAVAGYELGRSGIEGYIFGALGIAADGWKALAPIYIAALFRGGKLVTAGAATLVWVACFTFAVTAAIGLAAQNRSATTGGREAISVAYGAVTSELEDLRARRTRTTQVRSVSEVDTAIMAVLARAIPGAGTIATVSNNCIADTSRTRVACADIANLRIELAAAVEAERLDHRKAELEREQLRLSRIGGNLDADPQARLLARLLSGIVSIQDVGLGLVLLLVVMVEMVSGFAPVVLAEFVRVERARAATLAARSSATQMGEPIELRPVGDVFEYMADCIRPAPGATVPVAAVVLSYQQWCSSNERTALTAQAFVKEFERICREDLQGRASKKANDFRDIHLLVLLQS